MKSTMFTQRRWVKRDGSALVLQKDGLLLERIGPIGSFVAIGEEHTLEMAQEFAEHNGYLRRCGALDGCRESDEIKRTNTLKEPLPRRQYTKLNSQPQEISAEQRRDVDERIRKERERVERELAARGQALPDDGVLKACKLCRTESVDQPSNLARRGWTQDQTGGWTCQWCNEEKTR